MAPPSWPHRITFGALCAIGTGAVSGQITDLGVLNGGSHTQPFGVNADGTVVVGEARDGAAGDARRAFRWTQASGLVSLGVLNGGSSSFATDVNADGTVVVGSANDGLAGNAARAFRWTQAGGLVSLGVLNGGSLSSARGVNSDGTVVVGDARDGAAGNAFRAFRWTQASGLASLDVLNGGSSSFAAGVNADGTVVVGRAADGAAGNALRAFRWTQASGLVSLGVLNGGSESAAARVNADGTVVVGEARDGAASNAFRAFRWTQASGLMSLGVLNGGNESRANAVNADGTVVVGRAGDGAAGNAPRAFRWTQAGGMQKVEDWLRAAGVAVPADITFAAYGTNSDGSVVIGDLDYGSGNDRAFIARVAVAGSALGSGLITLPDVQQSLAAGARGARMALTTADTLLNGAHSRPLARRVPAGKNAFWLAGDLGRDDHGARSGDLGLAELGFGRNFGPAQLNLSLGQTWTRQDLELGGRARTEGTYLLVQALIPVAGDLWASLGAYGQRGDAELRRGYLNAGAQDASVGTAGAQTWGVRARLDWENAARFAGAQLTPYADLTRSRAKLEGYTETGGGFPARFDARTENATDLRLGANASRPLAGDARLLGTLEAAHRFEKAGARTTGSLVGLFAFDLPGAANQRDWLRAGIGVEGKLGGGTGSLMLNATTRGEAPSYWLAASWQITF